MPSPSILAIDNYDSFTFTLVDYLATEGASVTVRRNDELTVAEALAGDFDGVMISPGPGRPEDGGISIELAAACIDRRRPLLGVCLGHQAIAAALGMKVGRVPPMHGKISSVRHDGSGLFRGIPSPLSVTRYHSLAAIDPVGPLVANAWATDGVVMSLRHVEAPAHGLQFHPESVASEHGHRLIREFLSGCA